VCVLGGGGGGGAGGAPPPPPPPQPASRPHPPKQPPQRSRRNPPPGSSNTHPRNPGQLTCLSCLQPAAAHRSDHAGFVPNDATRGRRRSWRAARNHRHGLSPSTGRRREFQPTVRSSRKSNSNSNSHLLGSLRGNSRGRPNRAARCSPSRRELNRSARRTRMKPSFFFPRPV